jgi:DMSO/TMAO reductase YedYZ molybdopterin-dependent catalytic subunit
LDLTVHNYDSTGLIRATERNTLKPNENITPMERFFVLHHGDAPSPGEPENWRLTVDGDVERPLSLGIGELRELGEHTVVALAECAGTSRKFLDRKAPGVQLGNGSLGVGSWEGVPLAAVLHQAGLGKDTAAIVIGGPDGEPDAPFEKGLPIEKALDSDTLLCWRMNGADLPFMHGGPVRLVVPGWYSIWWVKWLKSLTVIKEPFRGYWQSEKYVYKTPGDTEEPIVSAQRVKSLIVRPHEAERLGGDKVTISGYAWCGDAAISRVDVQIDDGPWLQASIAPSDERWTWNRWALPWIKPEPGTHQLRSRAHDAKGRDQSIRQIWNELGYGNNFVQPVHVTVEA